MATASSITCHDPNRVSNGLKLLIVTQTVDKDHPVLGFFHRWIEEFAKHFERIEVICLFEGEHALPSNVRVHSLGKEKGSAARFAYALRFLRLIWKLRHEYDAVFVHMNPEYVVLGGPLWRMLHKRIGLWYVHRSVTLSLRFAAFCVDTIFTASKESFRLASKKVRIMGHGIDADMFTSSLRAQTELALITTGRVSATKRLVEMLAVLDELERRGVTFSFAVVGAPATREDEAYLVQLKEETAKRPYASRVRLYGPVAHAQLPEVLGRASVFLHMSVTGSMDKAVLEALAASVAVVSTSEAFDDAPIIRSQDEPSALADAIMEAQKSDRSALPAYVRSKHSLSQLIASIASTYETSR